MTLIDDLHDFWALLPSFQGSGTIPEGYAWLDLRGSRLLSHSRKDKELAPIADYLRESMRTGSVYLSDPESKAITAFPAIYYRKVGRYFDLRLDTATFSIPESKEKALMQALSQASAFHMPLIATGADSDGGTYYRYTLTPPKKATISPEELSGLPLDTLAIGSGVTLSMKSEPHLLVSGITGSGKTYLLESLIAQGVMKGGKVFVCDPKYSDLADFSKLIGVKSVGQSPSQIAGVLRKATEAMEDRYKAISKTPHSLGASALDLGYKPAIIVVDEYSALMGAADSKTKQEIEKYVHQIVLKGRQAGVFLLVATQRASVEGGIDSNSRYNFSSKIILGRSDATTLAMLFGSQEGNSLPDATAPGQGYIMRAKSTIPEEFYAYSYDISALIDYCKNSSAHLPAKKARQILMQVGGVVDRIMSKNSATSSEISAISSGLDALSTFPEISSDIKTAKSATAKLSEKYSEDEAYSLHYALEHAGDQLSYLV